MPYPDPRQAATTLVTPATQRPFWKRKRWIATAVLWLVITYPASFWPALYANSRGWVPATAAPLLDVVYWPVLRLSNRNGPLADLLTRAAIWVDDLGKQHAASD